VGEEMQVNLYNGDCLNWLKKMSDKSVDLVVTDPPYEIETSGAGIYKQEDKQYVKELVGMKDGFSEEILDELCRVMKKINIYLFCSQKQIIPLLDYFVKKKGCNWNLLSWHKSNPIPACGNKYLTDTEFILFFREKGVKVYGSFDTKKTYYVTPLNQKDKKKYGHPTCKPEEIVRNLIINSSNEGDIVLDPFMGSGTTGAVSVSINRKFIGIELNDQYFKVAQDRINTARSEWLDNLLGGVG
jgi:DNA modification methylase